MDNVVNNAVAELREGRLDKELRLVGFTNSLALIPKTF